MIPIVLDAIRDGIIDGTMAQNPYGQAFVGSEVLAMLASGCTPAEDAPYFVELRHAAHRSADNVETYGEDLKALTAEIADIFPQQYLSCPVGSTGHGRPVPGRPGTARRR